MESERGREGSYCPRIRNQRAVYAYRPDQPRA